MVLSNILTPASEVHCCNTTFTANQNFFNPSIRSNYGLAVFQFAAAKIWETFPPEFLLFISLLYRNLKLVCIHAVAGTNVEENLKIYTLGGAI